MTLPKPSNKRGGEAEEYSPVAPGTPLSRLIFH